MHSCFCFKVELLKAEKPWVRLAAASVTTADDAEMNTQELYRKFQGILNKLTPQKFQKLAEQALVLEIDSEEKLMGCVDKIFTNVCQFKYFSVKYLLLMGCINKILTNVSYLLHLSRLWSSILQL